MPILLMYVLLLYLSVNPQPLNAYPPGESSDYRSEARDSTTEVANTTNVISKVWHKLSNIFSPVTTTTEEPERKHELVMPEDRIPAKANSNREFRMAPMDFSRRGEDGNMWKRELGGEGNIFPIHHQLVLQSDLEEIPEENGRQKAEEVRSKDSTKHNNVVKVREKRSASSMISQPITVIVEEFDEGETEGRQIQRWKNIEKSTDWKTEKIVEGSDPVENLDKENYIEESKDVDFPFHSFNIQPIIIEDSLSQEITMQSQKELPSLKIIEI